MLKFGAILHPTDFSERSEDGFQAACSLARDHGRISSSSTFSARMWLAPPSTRRTFRTRSGRRLT